jgi:two-component system, chemotaxis family, protein-glutamate methylesterase/glutaminase
MSRPIRILIVDDSAFTRHLLVKNLNTYPDIEVVGQSPDGADALKKMVDLRPDVITLDVEMPRLGGLDTLERIMDEQPTPVIMFSALTQSGGRTTVQALLLGAVDFVLKPSATIQISDVIEDLVVKIKIAAGTDLKKTQQMPKVQSLPASNKTQLTPFRSHDPVIVIGASAGGPRALRQVLADFPQNLPAAVIIVQHMPAPFASAMTQRLDEISPLMVQEATSGQRLARGLVLVAPGGHHLYFANRKQVALNQDPRRNGVRPAVDVSMESAAEQHGKDTIGVILTGMGKDGTSGARHIRKAGGRIMVEHESTCLVYGMPGSIAKEGLANKIVPLPKVVPTLLDWIE